jgi:hypothetical protein
VHSIDLDRFRTVVAAQSYDLDALGLELRQIADALESQWITPDGALTRDVLLSRASEIRARASQLLAVARQAERVAAVYEAAALVALDVVETPVEEPEPRPRRAKKTARSRR